MTSYYKQASLSGLIIQYAFTYVDENRKKLNEYSTMEELANYLKKQNLVDKFATYAEKNGLKRRNLMIQRSHKLLERFVCHLCREKRTEASQPHDSALAQTAGAFYPESHHL